MPTHTECVFERPARVLIGAAEAARLLVIGMGGGSGFDDVPVPSLALDVCGAAACPVVVVRGAEGPIPTDRPVVLGLDDVGRDVGAITAAFADADGSAARLVVVHALRGPDAVLDAMAGHPADARAVAEEEIMTALSPWRSRHPGVPVEVRVVHGAPSGRLLEAAAPARLLVVGTNARGPAARMVLGSTSRSVVRRSPCPVMVVPREAHVLDLEAQETVQPVVDAAVTAPRRGACGRTTAVNCGERILVEPTCGRPTSGSCSCSVSGSRDRVGRAAGSRADQRQAAADDRRHDHQTEPLPQRVHHTYLRSCDLWTRRFLPGRAERQRR